MDSIWNLWNYVEYVESTWNLWGSVKYTPFGSFPGSLCNKSDHKPQIMVLTVSCRNINIHPSFSLISWLHVLSIYVHAVALVMYLGPLNLDT